MGSTLSGIRDGFQNRCKKSDSKISEEAAGTCSGERTPRGNEKHSRENMRIIVLSVELTRQEEVLWQDR
mgnify:CR=1 FL=1